MIEKVFVPLSMMLLVSTASLQAQFARTYGGQGYDDTVKIVEAADGGFVLFGTTETTVSYSVKTSWTVIKLTSDGTVEWAKKLVAAGYTPLTSVCETADCGYLLAGGAYDGFSLAKLDGLGQVVWQKGLANLALGETAAYHVCPAADSGAFVVGTTRCGDSYEAWVIRLSSDGSVIWQKAYDSGDYESGTCVAPTAGGGAVVVGWLGWAQAVLVFEIDALGAVLWQRQYTPGALSLFPGVQSIGAAADGGFLLAGKGFVLKLEADGAVEWARSYPGGDFEDVRPTQDGGSIAVGSLSGSEGIRMLVMKLDEAGNVSWQKAFGGFPGEYASSVLQAAVGDYVVAGHTGSFGSGGDLCVVRITPVGWLGDCGFSQSSLLAAGTINVSLSDPPLWALGTAEADQAAGLELADLAGELQSFALCAQRKLLTIFTNELDLPPGAVSPALGTHVYNPGTIVTITASSPIYAGSNGYKFEGWEGSATGIVNPVKVTVNDDMTVKANFSQCAGAGYDWGNGEWETYDYCTDGKNGGGGGTQAGCFVATAAYGSPLHPAVRLLREFRDKRLKTNPAGRVFVAAYYRRSPAAARVIARSSLLRTAVRILLVPVIALAAMVLKLGWVSGLLLLAAAAGLAFRGVRSRFRKGVT